MSFDKYIGRWVTFGGAAVAAILATFVANEAQILFGLHLSQTVLLGYLAPFLVGTFGLAWKWLENRGAQELTMLESDLHLSPAIVAEIEKVIESRLPVPAAPAPATSPKATAKP